MRTSAQLCNYWENARTVQAGSVPSARHHGTGAHVEKPTLRTSNTDKSSLKCKDFVKIIMFSQHGHDAQCKRVVWVHSTVPRRWRRHQCQHLLIANRLLKRATDPPKKGSAQAPLHAPWLTFGPLSPLLCQPKAQYPLNRVSRGRHLAQNSLCLKCKV